MKEIKEKQEQHQGIKIKLNERTSTVIGRGC